MGTFNVSLKTLTDRVSMEVVYTPKELDQICVEIAEVNRPGLFLAGYYDYFDKLRLQIMGLAEMNFLSGLSPALRSAGSAVPSAAAGCYRLPQRRTDPLPGDAGAGPEAWCCTAALQRDHLHSDGQPDQCAESGTGTAYHPPWCAGGSVRRRHPDPGRQRHRQERAGH